MPSRRHERHFTLEEAQELLNRARPLLEELATLKQALDADGFRFMPPSETLADIPLHTNGHHPPPQAFIRLMQVLQSLAAWGVQVRDLGQVLIDIPHLRADGEEVYLCWRAGEQDIGFWHPLESGFMGRQPLSTL